MKIQLLVFAVALWLPQLGHQVGCRKNRGQRRIENPGRATGGDNGCEYACHDRGGCRVEWVGNPRAGPSKGYCTSQGRCRSTPPECRTCKAHCEYLKSPNSQPLLPVEAVLAEFEEEQQGPPSPPPVSLGPAPPAPPPPIPVGPPPPRPTRPPPTPRPTRPPPPPPRPTRPLPPRPTRPLPPRPTGPPRPPRPTRPRPVRRGGPLEFVFDIVREKMRLKKELLRNIFRG